MKTHMIPRTILLLLLSTLFFSVTLLANPSYLQDEASIIEEDETLVEELRKFELHTEVAPYVITLDNLNGNTPEEYSEKFYNSYFKDGNHLLILIYKDVENYQVTLFSGYSIGYFLSTDVTSLIASEASLYFDTEDYQNGIVFILEECSIFLTSDKEYHDILLPEVEENTFISPETFTAMQSTETFSSESDNSSFFNKDSVVLYIFIIVLLLVIFLSIIKIITIIFKYLHKVAKEESEVEKKNIDLEIAKETTKTKTIEFLSDIEKRDN